MTARMRKSVQYVLPMALAQACPYKYSRFLKRVHALLCPFFLTYSRCSYIEFVIILCLICSNNKINGRLCLSIFKVVASLSRVPRTKRVLLLRCLRRTSTRSPDPELSRLPSTTTAACFRIRGRLPQTLALLPTRLRCPLWSFG